MWKTTHNFLATYLMLADRLLCCWKRQSITPDVLLLRCYKVQDIYHLTSWNPFLKMSSVGWFVSFWEDTQFGVTGVAIKERVSLVYYTAMREHVERKGLDKQWSLVAGHVLCLLRRRMSCQWWLWTLYWSKEKPVKSSACDIYPVPIGINSKLDDQRCWRMHWGLKGLKVKRLPLLLEDSNEKESLSHTPLISSVLFLRLQWFTALRTYCTCMSCYSHSHVCLVLCVLFICVSL